MYFIFWNWTNTVTCIRRECKKEFISFYKMYRIHYLLCKNTHTNTHMSLSRGTPGKTNVKWCDMNRVLFLFLESISLYNNTAAAVVARLWYALGIQFFLFLHVELVKDGMEKNLHREKMCVNVYKYKTCLYFYFMHSWFKLDVTELVFPYISWCVIFKNTNHLLTGFLRVDNGKTCLEGVIWFILLTSFKEFCVSF